MQWKNILYAKKEKTWGMTWKFEHLKNKGSAFFVVHFWHNPFTPIYCSCVWTQIQLSPVSKDNDLGLQWFSKPQLCAATQSVMG